MEEGFAALLDYANALALTVEARKPGDSYLRLASISRRPFALSITKRLVDLILKSVKFC